MTADRTLAAFIGRRIVEHRELLGLTQAGLAHAMGLKSRTHVSRWELGICSPNAEHMMLLRHALGIPIEALFPAPKHDVRNLEDAARRVG